MQPIGDFWKFNENFIVYKECRRPSMDFDCHRKQCTHTVVINGEFNEMDEYDISNKLVEEGIKNEHFNYYAQEIKENNEKKKNKQIMQTIIQNQKCSNRLDKLKRQHCK